MREARVEGLLELLEEWRRERLVCCDLVVIPRNTHVAS